MCECNTILSAYTIVLAFTIVLHTATDLIDLNVIMEYILSLVTSQIFSHLQIWVLRTHIFLLFPQFYLNLIPYMYIFITEVG